MKYFCSSILFAVTLLLAGVVAGDDDDDLGTPISDTTTVEIGPSGALVSVRNVEFACTSEGARTSTITDPATGDSYLFTLNCHAPEYDVNLIPRGYIPTAMWSVTKQVVLTMDDNGADNATGPEQRKQVITRTSVRAPHTEGFLSGLASGVSSAFCTLGFPCQTGVKAALKKVEATLRDTNKRIDTLNRIAQDTQTFENATLGVLQNDGITISNILDQNEQQDNDISLLSEGLRGVKDFEIGFANSATRDLENEHNQIVGLFGGLVALENQTVRINAQTATEIRKLTQQVLNLDRLLTLATAQLYEDSTERQTRRLLSAAFWGDDPSITPLSSTAFTTGRGTPPTAQELLITEFQNPISALEMAEASFQGTTIDGAGNHYAVEIRVRFIVDITKADAIGPSFSYRNMLSVLGGGPFRNSTDCNSGFDVGGFTAGWSCVSAFTVTQVSCQLRNDSLVFPFNTDPTSLGHDLVAYRNVTGTSPMSAYCTTAVDGTVQWVEDLEDGAQGVYGPTLVRTSIDAWQNGGIDNECLHPPAGVAASVDGWVNYTATGNNLRVYRPDYNRYYDMYVENGDANYSCTGDANDFLDEDNNYRRAVFILSTYLEDSYNTRIKRLMAQAELIYGTLPDNMTIYENKFDTSVPGQTDGSEGGIPQRVEALTYIRVQDTGNPAADVRVMYRWEPAGDVRQTITASILHLGSGNYSNGTSGSVPGQGNTTLEYEIVNTVSSSVQLESLIPYGELLVGRPAEWASGGWFIDADYDLLSDSGTAGARRGKLSYIMRPVLATNESLPTDLWDMGKWIETYHARFDALSVGDGCQDYKMEYTVAGLCDRQLDVFGDPIGGTGSDKHKPCLFLDRFSVATGNTPNSVIVRPRNGWSSTVTVRLPVGSFVSQFTSTCPGYIVSPSGGSTQLTLTSNAPSSNVVCLAVFAGDSPGIVEPACTAYNATTRQQSIPAGGSVVVNIDGSDCAFQYVQVYKLPNGTDSCPSSLSILQTTAVPCFAAGGAPGIALYTAHSSVDSQQSSVASSQNIYAQDATVAGLLNVMDRSIAISQSISDIARQEMTDEETDAAIAAAVASHLAAVNASILPLSTPGYVAANEAKLNNTVNALTSQIAAEVAARRNQTAFDRQLQQQNAVALQTADQALNDTTVQLAIARNETAKVKDDMAQLKKDINRIKTHVGLDLGKIADGAEQFVEKAEHGVLGPLLRPLGGISDMITSLFRYLIPLLVVGGIGYCVFVQVRKRNGGSGGGGGGVTVINTAQPPAPKDQVGDQTDPESAPLIRLPKWGRN